MVEDYNKMITMNEVHVINGIESFSIHHIHLISEYYEDEEDR